MPGTLSVPERRPLAAAGRLRRQRDPRLRAAHEQGAAAF
jgi:hypothetical protein